MNFKEFISYLTDPNPLKEDYLKNISQKIVDAVKGDQLKILDIVKKLDPILTNDSHEIRFKGVQVLANIIVQLPKDYFREQELKVFTEFLSMRLIDHQTMQEPVLKCLSHLVDCKNKPTFYNQGLLQYFKSKVHLGGMLSSNRYMIYEIINKIVMQTYSTTATLDAELVYSMISLFEGECDPQNLVYCFGIITFIFKNFKDIEPYLDDLFEWLTAYYPIDYTPDEKFEKQFDIRKENLVEALDECFFATELNSDNIQTLSLERLESNKLTVKIEALRLLKKSYEKHSFKSIQKYASSVWSQIRMECLKETKDLDVVLAKSCYQTFSALGRRLVEDEEAYYTFILNLHDEISIAFRKPSLNLFESACKLITHIAQPQLKAFKYILFKILIPTVKIIEEDDFRPTSGLAYILEQLSIHHPKGKLDEELNLALDRISLQLIPRLDKDSQCLRLMNSMLDCGVEFKSTTLDLIINTINQIENPSLDLEECLVKVCFVYNRTDIIFDGAHLPSSNIEDLIKMISSFEQQDYSKDANRPTKFSTYLRLITILLHDSESSKLKSLKLDDTDKFLNSLRIIASKLDKGDIIVNHIANIHGILFNKLDEEFNNLLLIKFFSSEYCQGLMSTGSGNHQVYLEVLKLVLKSLVVRNDKFFLPIINLLLNYITSDHVDEISAIEAGRCFKYVHLPDNSSKFTLKYHYRVFAIHKQKFYMQSSKEIKLRFEKEENPTKKYLLLCALAFQIPNIHSSIFKKDYEWLIRELMQLLIRLQDSHTDVNEHLIAIIYDCLVSLIIQDQSGKLMGLLDSLIILNLKFSTNAKTMEVRRRALNCLATIASTYSAKELLTVRGMVVDKLRDCLGDKKRLVRKEAASARLKWILIGQPVGGQHDPYAE